MHKYYQNDINNHTIGVQCLLHTLCNLRCKFCFETKEKGIREDTKINIDYIKQLPDEICKTMIPIIKRDDAKIFKADIMGGELFSDDLPDSIFDIYEEFVYSLESKLKKESPNIKFIYYFFSNGILTNHKRVERFLKKFDSKITLSYDPVDRFSCNSQKEVWYETFKYFKECGAYVDVATLLTKRNIDAYIEGDKFFELIGPSIYVDNIEYAPRLDYHKYLPNDDDLFNYYKWAIDNGKFNIAHVNDILKNKSSCNPGSSYMFGECFGGQKKYICECIEDSPLDKEYYYGKCANQITPNTKYSIIESIGVEKRGCLMCDYYNQCPKMCWKNILFDKYEMTTCPIRRIYEYIEDNPNITIEYENWRKMYESEWRKLI
jgi:hypothetical protein